MTDEEFNNQFAAWQERAVTVARIPDEPSRVLAILRFVGDVRLEAAMTALDRVQAEIGK